MKREDKFMYIRNSIENLIPVKPAKEETFHFSCSYDLKGNIIYTEYIELKIFPQEDCVAAKIYNSQMELTNKNYFQGTDIDTITYLIDSLIKEDNTEFCLIWFPDSVFDYYMNK